MFGGNHGNRGKHLEKVVQLFSHLPDKDDQENIAKEGLPVPGGEAGKVDKGLSNAPMPGHQTGELPPNMQKKRC